MLKVQPQSWKKTTSMYGLCTLERACGWHAALNTGLNGQKRWIALALSLQQKLRVPLVQRSWQWLPLYHVRAMLLLLVCMVCTACAPAPQTQVSFAFEGPPLVIAALKGEQKFEGTMERYAMVGSGELTLHALDSALECRGSVAVVPDRKGRVRGVLSCSNESFFMFSMRTLGADQGFGVGRFVRKKSGYYYPEENVDKGLLEAAKEAVQAEGGHITQNEVSKKNEAAEQAGIGVQATDKSPAYGTKSESWRKAGQGKGYFDAEDAALTVFFYHPWVEEAWRRLPSIKADIEQNNPNAQTHSITPKSTGATK